MTQQNRFKQNEEKIISRVEEMRQAGKISDEQARQMIQVGQQQANSPQSMQDMLAGEHAFKQRQSQMARQQAGGMPSGSGEGLAPDIGNRRATGQPQNLAGDPRVPPNPQFNPQFVSPSQRQNLSPSQMLERDRQIMHPGSTMGRPPPGIIESNVGPERFDEPMPITETGQERQMVAGQQRQPPAMPPQGLLDRGIGGFRSIGRSLGAGAKSLFDDPSRMAMLRGGLSMMDPNTYYDPQGFGSVFTGLNKGLGAAEQGHAGVLARRKSVADTFKAKAEADYAASGKGGEGQNEFRRVLAKYNDPNTSAEDKKWLGGRLEKLSQPGTDFDVKGMRNYIWETAFPSNTQLSETLDTFVNTMNSTVDTDAGIDFGPGSEFKSSVYAVLSETFGQDLGDKGQRAANTRTYMSSMGIQVGQTIKLFGAGTGLSDADLKFAKDITGQDPGSFSKASLEMLLVLNEGQMRGKLLKANKVMNSMYGGTAPEHMLQELPPMTKNLQKHIAKEMKKSKGWVVKGKKVTEKPDGWNDAYEGQWDNLVAGRPDKPTTAAVSAKKQRMSGWTFTVND